MAGPLGVSSDSSGVRMSFSINTENAKQSLETLFGVFKKIEPIVDKINTAFAGLSNSMNKNVIVDQALKDQVHLLTDENKRLTNSLTSANGLIMMSQQRINELAAQIKNINIQHKDETKALLEKNRARQVEIEKLAIANQLYYGTVKSLKQLNFEQLNNVNLAFRKEKALLTNLAPQDRINEAARSMVRNYKEQIPLLKRLSQDLGNLTGVYDKVTGNFRGHTTGLRRSVGALRNNLLLVTFAVSGFVASIMSFIKNAAAFDSALTGLTEVAGAMGQNMYKAKTAAEEFAKEGLLTIQEAAAGYKNLIAWGLSMDQAKKAMITLTDAAAYNRQGTLSIGEAVVGATQGLKNYISNLVDNAGITKNLSNIEKDYAKSIGTTAEKLTEAQRTQGIYLGILKEGDKFENNRLRYMKDFQGTLSKTRAVWLQFSATLGKVFMPVAERVTEILFKVMDAIGLMTKEGEINIKAKLVSSFMYLETVVKFLYNVFMDLLYPIRIVIGLFKLLGTDANDAANAGTALTGSLIQIGVGSWALARALSFLSNTFTAANSQMLLLWATAILITEALFLITKGQRDYREAIIRSTESIKKYVTDKQLYHRSLLNEMLLNKDVVISNDGKIISYGKTREEIEKNIVALLKYMEIEDINNRRKELAKAIEEAPRAAYTAPLLSKETLFSSKNLIMAEELNDQYNRILQSTKEISLMNPFKLTDESQKEYLRDYLSNVTDFIYRLEKIGGDSQAINILKIMVQQISGMGAAAAMSKNRLDQFLEQLAKLKNTVETPNAGEKNKSTLEQIFGLLPKFSELKFEDIGSSVIDTMFNVKYGVIQEQAQKLHKSLTKAVSDGLLDSKTDIKGIVNRFVSWEKDQWVEAYEKFTDDVTPSIEKATNEFFLALEKMSKSERKVNFILESIGGGAAYNVTLKQIDELYRNMAEAITAADKKYKGEGSSFEAQFGISADQAKAELVLRKAIEKSIAVIKEQTRALNENYDAKERELKLKYDTEVKEIAEYERKKQLVELEIELINRKSMAQAIAMEFALNLHESVYNSMEKISGAFFDHELRRQFTLAKAVKMLLQDQLSFFLQTAAKRIQSKAAEAAIDAAYLVGQAIIYQNPEFLAAAGKMAMVAAGYAALAGTVGGLANRVQSQSISMPNVGGTSNGSGSRDGSVAGGTKAGAVTSAGQMIVNIRPSTTINGQNIYLGSFGSVSEAGVALGNMEVNIMKQALETGEVDLTRSTRR